jgi:hypothetical protein
MFNLFGNKKSNEDKTEYKFKDPEYTVCFVCDHVLSKHRPILYAAHDKEDSSWQFLCGKDDHIEENSKIISLKQATEIDVSINDLYEMPLGVGAERKNTQDKWVPFRLAD